MPFDYSDDGSPVWPTDDLPAKFAVDEEFKSTEEYVDEYDGV